MPHWLSDGTLSRFSTVILDEFHERRWDTDLLLALLRARGGHRLVLTSATLAANPLAMLIDADLGERVPGPVRLEDGRPVRVEERHYANRVIERREREPTGDALTAALTLVEPGDLAFPGIPEWERQRFDDRYPSSLNIDTMRLAVHYDVDRKRITVERTGGDRKTQPQRWELPAWQGWRIRFRDGSKVVDIK